MPVWCIKCIVTQAIFNYADEKAKYCVKCKSPDMVNVNNPKCIKCNVTQASFKYDGEKAEYCSKCKSDGVIDVNNRECIVCNVKHASFNYAGEKKDYTVQNLSHPIRLILLPENVSHAMGYAQISIMLANKQNTVVNAS